MKKISHLVVHYSATYSDQDFGVKDIDKMHKKRGWKGVGYHYVIRRKGKVEKGRPDNQVGAHVGGQNRGKLGICWIGGLERSSGPNVGIDNRTMAQKAALARLIASLLVAHPGAKVVGHRDLAATQCPAFDVGAWWTSVNVSVAPQKPVQPLVPAQAGMMVAAEPETQPTAPAGPKHGANLLKSRTMQGAVASEAAGSALVVDSTTELASAAQQAEASISAGTVFSLVIGLIIMFGAGFAIYARWDDGGRPLPGFIERRLNRSET